jgi:hypothetical protein
MNTYKIKTQKIVEQTYIINAENEDQAKQLIESGNYYGECDDDDYENECVDGNEYIEFLSVNQIK